MLEKRDTLNQGSSTAAGHRNAQDTVSANLGLIGCSVDLHHKVVDLQLLSRVHANELGCNQSVDCFNTLQDTLAHVDTLVSITKLNGLEFTGGRTRRHGATTHHTIVQSNVNFDGRVTSRVEDLTGMNFADDGHGKILWGRART